MQEFNPQIAKKKVIEAFERFGKTRSLSEDHETETRCELIDRILTAVGWESGGFSREVSTGTGDYVDYELPRSVHPILVIEAKRSGKTFALDGGKRETGRTLALKTILKNGGKTLKEALKQASGYCNDRAVPYACVTNGYQWIFFRGLSSEACSWNDGRAIVFASSEEISTNFDEFLACIAPHKIISPELPRLLTRPTPQELPRSITPLENLTLRKKTVSGEILHSRKIIGQQFFGQIHGSDRPKMLAKCYVEPGGRANFSHSLQRLLDDTLSIDTFKDETIHKGNTKDFVGQLQNLDVSGLIRYPILVVGNVGVGKTTFLYRTLAALREVPNADVAAQKKADYKTDSDAAMYAYVDLENQGNISLFDDREVQRETAAIILEKLSQSAISTLKKRDDISENARFEANPYIETTLRTMLRERLSKERSSAESYFNRNPNKWDDREYEIIQEYRKESVVFLIHYIRHLRARFKRRDDLRYPILLILDNLDQASPEYQRCIYGLALRLAKETPAVTIVSIREDTFAEGRQTKGFLSSSPLEFVFHVEAPALDELLRQRVKYIRYCLKHNDFPKGLGNEVEEIKTVANIVTKGLVAPPRNGLEVISALSGHNIRSALRIVREFLSGTTCISSMPEPTVDYLLEALIATVGQLDHQLDLKRLFDAEPHVPALHSLRLRLLGYFSWAYEVHPDRSLLENTESVIAKFAAWGYPAYAVEQALQALLSEGLLTADKQITQKQLPNRMSISSIGYAHISRLAPQKVYRTAMALISRWYDQDLAHQFIRQATRAGTQEGTSLGDIVAANSVEVFDAYLHGCRILEDKLLSSNFSTQPWVQEVLSRSNAWNNSLTPNASTKGQSPSQDGLASKQLSLINITPNELPRLSRNTKLCDTVWVPRILWALEYARINHQGPLIAAQIARILTDKGDIEVPKNNVARAFRDFRGRKDIEVYFNRHGKRYSITEVGSETIRSCIQSQHIGLDELDD